MPDLYERLTAESRPIEILVGKTLEKLSKTYKYIPENTSMDYDVFLQGEKNNIKVEVKVHAGISKGGYKYETACLEVKEYQYKHSKYVLSHWLKSDFDVMAHVDKAAGKIYLYNGLKIRQWAYNRRHTARYSNKVLTANLTIPWVFPDAGFIMCCDILAV